MYSDIHIHVCVWVFERERERERVCVCKRSSNNASVCNPSLSDTHTHTHTHTPTHNVRKVRSERADWWLPLLLDGQTPTLQIGGDIKKGEWEKSEFQRQMFLFIVRNLPKKIERFALSSRLFFKNKTRHLKSTFQIPRSSSWAFGLMWMTVGDNKNNDKQKKCFFPLFCTFSSFFEAREKICPFYQCHTYMVLWDRLRRMENQSYKTYFILKKIKWYLPLKGGRGC